MLKNSLKNSQQLLTSESIPENPTKDINLKYIQIIDDLNRKIIELSQQINIQSSYIDSMSEQYTALYENFNIQSEFLTKLTQQYTTLFGNSNIQKDYIDKISKQYETLQINFNQQSEHIEKLTLDHSEIQNKQNQYIEMISSKYNNLLDNSNKQSDYIDKISTKYNDLLENSNKQNNYIDKLVEKYNEAVENNQVQSDIIDKITRKYNYLFDNSTLLLRKNKSLENNVKFLSQLRTKTNYIKQLYRNAHKNPQQNYSKIDIYAKDIIRSLSLETQKISKSDQNQKFRDQCESDLININSILEDFDQKIDIMSNQYIRSEMSKSKSSSKSKSKSKSKSPDRKKFEKAQKPLSNPPIKEFQPLPSPPKHLKKKVEFLEQDYNKEAGMCGLWQTVVPTYNIKTESSQGNQTPEKESQMSNLLNESPKPKYKQQIIQNDQTPEYTLHKSDEKEYYYSKKVNNQRIYDQILTKSMVVSKQSEKSEKKKKKKSDIKEKREGKWK